ncbi:hypothetical protein Hypma_005925 [Hypsizygus marmoreus]|uniref:Uncharacterized protein n=1 Tax=Hypsizygus marmoreus TaxID=39966 RepID=A0A369KCI5_HYPMA|nr:hypothetical protein Hypma_005925 [Hypsizygus marmoreus]
MEYICRDSTDDLIRYTFEDDASLSWSWGHISKASQALAAAAMNLKDVPFESYSQETGPAGQYLELDWARDKDWFWPEIPWRTHVPAQSADNPDSWWGDFRDTSWGHSWIELDSSHSYILNSEWADQCLEDLQHMADCCTAIKVDGIYPNTNPSPALFYGSLEGRVYDTIHEAEVHTATLKRYMMDGIGFLWWFKETFHDWKTGLSDEIIEHIEAWTSSLKVKRGVLLDLSRDWPCVDIYQMARQDVPVTYAWTAKEAQDPRFQRFSPEFINAYWDYVDTIPSGIERYFAVPDLRERFPAIMDYDDYLQNGMAGFTPDGFYPGPERNNARVFVCDFEGWRRREITDPDLKEALRTRYHARMLWDNRERVVLYWRFRPRPPPTVGSTMDVDVVQENLHELRALYYFQYAPHSGRSFDREHGELERPPLVETPPHHHELHLHDEPQNSGSLEQRLSSVSRTSTPTHPREGRAKVRSRHQPYDKHSVRHQPISVSSAASDRESRHGGNRSLASRLSDAPHASRIPPALAQRISSPASTRAGLPTPSDIAWGGRRGYDEVGSADLRNWRASDDMDGNTFAAEEFRQSVEEARVGMNPDKSFSALNARCVWHPDVLHYGILQIPLRETSVRLKLHAILDDNKITIAELLNWAISRRLRFSIAYGDSDLKHFLPNNPSEGDHSYGALYRGHRTEVTLRFNRGPADFIEQWKTAATTILLRPHARAVVFHGGLLSRIGEMFRRDELIIDAMSGPSIAVTLHRQGALDTRHPAMAWSDQLSTDECNLLYGFTSGDPNKAETDRTLWPTEAHLWDFLAEYSGSWSVTCETIFSDILSKVERGVMEPLTRGGWSQYLKNKRYREWTPLGAPTDEKWRRAASMTELYYPSTERWHGSRLEDIELPPAVQM